MPCSGRSGAQAPPSQYHLRFPEFPNTQDYYTAARAILKHAQNIEALKAKIDHARHFDVQSKEEQNRNLIIAIGSRLDAIAARLDQLVDRISELEHPAPARRGSRRI